jgi:hypothetical protein
MYSEIHLEKWTVKNGWIYMKGSMANNGYMMVVLSRNNVKPKGFLVHRLVATAYLDNPCSYPSVNHKNGVKLDNGIENLEWVSTKQNIAVYDSAKSASEATGYKYYSITKVTRGERNSLFGFTWKFSKIEI